jgi:hypothetical protein
MNIGYAVSALRMGSLATVLIGSGEGNLEVDAATRGLLSGICDSLHHVQQSERIKTVEIVEYSESRYEEIVQIARQIEKDQVFEHMVITVDERKLPEVKKAPAHRRQPRQPASRPASTRFVNRITIETNDEGYSAPDCSSKVLHRWHCQAIETL